VGVVCGVWCGVWSVVGSELIDLVDLEVSEK